MLGMIHSITRPEVFEREQSASFWFDVGANFPMGSFQNRQWTNGFSLQLGHKVWHSGGLLNVDGVLGFFLNEDSRFNEAQSRAYYDAGGTLTTGGPVESHRHLLVPFSVELKLEGQNPALSPFVSLGPSLNWARETTAWQDSTLVLPVIYVSDDWPADEVASIPTPGALSTQAVKNVTKIHPGYAARAGFRVGQGALLQGGVRLNCRTQAGAVQ